MNFPISGTHLNPVVLVVVGFVVGIGGGFFGVGGSFLAGPALFWLRLPMNFVIGTDLAHIVGKSLVAVRRHFALGQVDVKLACLMMIGTLPGVEVGARGIEMLKRRGDISRVVGSVFAVALILIAVLMAWEVWTTLRSHHPTGQPKAKARATDHKAFSSLARRIQGLPFPPYIRLPKSNIPRISFWVVLGVAFVSGVFSGFLGGGAGYIRMPSMVYLLGVPTHLAVGTDLLEVIVSAGYGTVTHALKGNVDILVALVMHTGAAIGAQLGAFLTQYFHGVWIRLAFIPLPLIGAFLLLQRL